MSGNGSNDIKTMSTTTELISSQSDKESFNNANDTNNRSNTNNINNINNNNINITNTNTNTNTNTHTNTTTTNQTNKNLNNYTGIIEEIKDAMSLLNIHKLFPRGFTYKSSSIKDITNKLEDLTFNNDFNV